MNSAQTVRIDNGGLWTGDVWKVLPIIKEYRSDINVHVFDAYPTGLVCCTNLDPGNDSLQRNYAESWRKWAKTELEEYGFSRFIDECEILSTTTISTPEDLRRYFWL